MPKLVYMKKYFLTFYLFILFMVLIYSQISAQVFGTMTDSRDGKKYRTIKIDKFELMAENLNYQNAGICYDNQKLFCQDYGRLYNINEIKNNICPAGWHVPTYSEWKYMFTKLNGKIENFTSGFTRLNVNGNPLNLKFSGFGNTDSFYGNSQNSISFLGIEERGFYASSTTASIKSNEREWEEWSVVRFENFSDTDSKYKQSDKSIYFLFGTSIGNYVSCRCMKDY